MRTVIPPSGHEHAAGAVLAGGADRLSLISERVVEATRKTLPSAGARGDEVGAPEFLESSTLRLKGMARVVTPNHG